jgi:hypothetical protein
MSCTKDCKEEQGNKFTDGIFFGMVFGGLIVCILCIFLTSCCVTPSPNPPNPTPVPTGWGQDHWDEPETVIQ